MKNIDHFLAIGEPPASTDPPAPKTDWTLPIALGAAGVALLAAGWAMSGRKTNPIGAEVGADEVLIAKSAAGFAEPIRRRNPTYEVSVAEAEPVKKRKRSRTWQADPEAMSLYDGHEGLLVRTALIRPPNWDPKSLLTVTSARDVFKLVKHLTYADQEHMVVIALDRRMQVSAIYETGIGTATQTATELRSIAKIMTLTGTSACIIVHNHPSGDPQPSMEDRTMTRETGRGLQCMHMELADHVIVGRSGYTSLRDTSAMGNNQDWYDSI